MRPIEYHELACKIQILLKKDGIDMSIKEIARRLRERGYKNVTN